jgi:predicted transcriptional regulator
MGNTLPTPKGREEEIVTLLVDMGVSRKTAKTLTYLSNVDESISKTIEEETRLRQPEVSTALKELRGRGWIEKEDIKKEGKGRPIHSYKMVVPFDRAIKTLVKEKKSEIAEMQSTLKKLNNIVNTE